MAQNKKKVTKYNLWTMPADEWHKGLKSIRIETKKLDALSEAIEHKRISKVSVSSNQKTSQLQFNSAGHSPLFGRLKRA